MELSVTGGCGFIGNSVHYILKRYSNYQTVNFDKLIYDGNPANRKDSRNNANYSFVQGDLCNSVTVNKLTEKIDHFAYFTAKSYIDRSTENGSIFTIKNVLRTDTLLKSALANKTFGEKIHVFAN
jgi:dTDP-glucose 4,6-dehydratase